jgi:hypothetical protein
MAASGSLAESRLSVLMLRKADIVQRRSPSPWRGRQRIGEGCKEGGSIIDREKVNPHRAPFDRSGAVDRIGLSRQVQLQPRNYLIEALTKAA